MPCETVQVGTFKYLFSPDDKRPLGGRTQVIFYAQIRDNVTGELLTGPVTIESDLIFAFPRTNNDGVIGLVGVPWTIFPWMAMHNYAVEIKIKAEGYVPNSVTILIPKEIRAIKAQEPVPSTIIPSTMITVDNSTKLSPGEKLLIGNTGPHLRLVDIASVDAATNKIMVSPELSRSYVGEPAVPVVPDNFRATAIGDITLFRI